MRSLEDMRSLPAEELFYMPAVLDAYRRSRAAPTSVFATQRERAPGGQNDDCTLPLSLAVLCQRWAHERTGLEAEAFALLALRLVAEEGRARTGHYPLERVETDSQ
jgi:hypothetical protein